MSDTSRRPLGSTASPRGALSADAAEREPLGGLPLDRLQEGRIGEGEDAVGDGGGVAGGADFVDAEDVGSGEDRGRVCDGGRELVDSLRMNRAGEKAFAGDAGEDWEAERVELIEVGEQRVVFVEDLPEAEAWVEDDFVSKDAGGSGGFQAFGEIAEDQG